MNANDRAPRGTRLTAALGGTAFVVLQSVVHTTIAPPASSAPAASLAQYYSDRARSLATVSFVVVIAELAFIAFVIAAVRLLFKPFAGLGLAALLFGVLGALAGSLAVIPDATASVMVRQSGPLDPTTARTLFNLHQLIGGLILLWSAVFVLLVGYQLSVSWRRWSASSVEAGTPLVPRVLLGFTVVTVMSMLLNGGARFFLSTDDHTSGISRLHHLHDVTLAPWILITAFLLLRLRSDAA